MIAAIMACDKQGGIAKKGSMPWPKNEKDLNWFKKNTYKDVVVMGSKTWMDPQMPSPLPGRINVVVTTDPEKCPGADRYITENVVDEILKLKEEFVRHNIWIIGGANLLNQTFDILDRFYITLFNEEYRCDTYIPLKDILRRFEQIGNYKDDDLEFKVLQKISIGKYS